MTISIIVQPIPILKDNYIWAIIDEKSRAALIVDPGEGKPVETYLETHSLTLRGIIITHHHWDHTNGILGILSKYDVPVFAPAENIVGTTQIVKEGDTIHIPHFPLVFKVLAIPGHTLGHVAYYSDHMLFCGDTLFASGCGRIFEGTPSMMYASLERLAALPEDTKIYCAHEYTLNNLRFATLVDPTNEALNQRLAKVEALREKQQPSLPCLLSEEKITNPFLRCDTEVLREAASEHAKTPLKDPVAVFAELRKWKDRF